MSAMCLRSGLCVVLPRWDILGCLGTSLVLLVRRIPCYSLSSISSFLLARGLGLCSMGCLVAGLLLVYLRMLLLVLSWDFLGRFLSSPIGLILSLLLCILFYGGLGGVLSFLCHWRLVVLVLCPGRILPSVGGLE